MNSAPTTKFTSPSNIFNQGMSEGLLWLKNERKAENHKNV